VKDLFRKRENQAILYTFFFKDIRSVLGPRDGFDNGSGVISCQTREIQHDGGLMGEYLIWENILIFS